MILFFETYSIIQTLFLSKYVRKAKIIYFHKRLSPPLKYNSHSKMIVEKLIRFLNRQVKIETLPAERIKEHNWVMNKRAVDVVEKSTSDIKDSAIYKSVLKIIRDRNILKFYKMQFVDDISARLLFFKTAKELIEEYKDCIFLVPADREYTRLQKEFFSNETLNSYILPGNFMINQIRKFFLKIRALIIFLLLPSVYIILNLKKITLRRINKKRYDIAMPIIWGFHEGDVIIKGVKGYQDDGYLYNKTIIPGQIIHVFKYRRFPPEIKKSYKNVMGERGIPYIDSEDYKINVNFLLIVMKIQLKIIMQILSKFFFWRDKSYYINYTNKLIYSMLKKYLEFENVDYKVELIRHDYDSSHIIETILSNQHNKRTVGIQHGSTAGPYVFPHLCYVHLDKYCIFSDRHLELHAPFWNKLNFKQTGNYRIDYLIEISKDHPLMESIKNRVVTLHGYRKYIVLILFPGPLEHNVMEKWDEIYEALCELKSIDIDCNVFLRFRGIDNLENSHISRFKNLPQMDNRFIIDLINFTTYELMAVSDMIISYSPSSSVIEAVSLNKKTFTFDYMGVAKYYFSKYGKDIVLNKKNDVLNLFKNLENNFTGYDCNWELLRKEYNYHYDGKCLERLQQVISETIQEVS